MNDDIEFLIKEIRDLGYLIKLDTNGYFPEKLKYLIGRQYIDYAAMDIKNSLPRYAQTVGVTLDTDKIKESAKIIKETTGAEVKLYRPPYGEYNDTVIKATNENGYIPIQWSLDTLDYTKITGEKMWERLKNKITAGDIILMHNGTEHTADSLDMIIKNIKSSGFEVARVSDIIYTENYTIDTNGTQRRK